MIKATKEFLEQNEALFENRKKEILNSKDTIKITGTAYYVANDGDDNNDGKSENTPWKTTKKVSEFEFLAGDGVFFRRGDLFRGGFTAKSGVTYAAYGNGDKPKFYSGEKNMADESLWELYDSEHNIWKYKEKIIDVGTLVFDDGVAHSRKLVPNFKDGGYVLRDDPTKEFVMENDMTNDLDLFFDYRKCEEGETVPRIRGKLGDLYLRCDSGNPGKLYNSIEALICVNLISLGRNPDVTIDNLCIKYVGAHGIGGHVFIKGLTVTNCEFGWIGGGIQHYNPNGRVTRYGNAIEIYGACKDYTVSNNYIYEVYDAGVTHQFYSDNKCMMEDILYSDNVIENCVYAIEYFLGQGCEDLGKIKNCMIKNNILRFTGYGWGRQRYNPDTPAAIKTWSAQNASENYIIKNNIFDRGTQNFLHIAAITTQDLPKMDGNTYIQHLNGPLGRFGSNKENPPELHAFDMQAEEKINNIFGDKNAKVYYID